MAIGTQGNPNLMRVPGADLPHVQYQLDDPAEYNDEHIFVVGTGDAGIENALGLAADEAQGNVVTILNRSTEFASAKAANVKALMAAAEAGRLAIMTETTTAKVEPGFVTLDSRDGEVKLKCDRIIARMGSAPPRAFVESCGIEFTSGDRLAFPRSEEHTSELQSLMRISYAVFCLQKKNNQQELCHRLIIQYL